MTETFIANENELDKYENIFIQLSEMRDINEKRYVALQKHLLELIQGPFTQMKTEIETLKLEIEALKSGEIKRTPARRGRQAITRKDYNLIQNFLEEGKPKSPHNWSSVARDTGIPASTVRKIATMPVEIADKLPAGD